MSDEGDTYAVSQSSPLQVAWSLTHCCCRRPPSGVVQGCLHLPSWKASAAGRRKSVPHLDTHLKRAAKVQLNQKKEKVRRRVRKGG